MPFLAAIALIGAGCSESESTNDAATNAEPFACTPAPEDLDRVDLTPPWSDVTERQLELRLRREDSRRDTPDGFSRTPVDLTIEQLDGELSFRWASRTTLFSLLWISSGFMMKPTWFIRGTMLFALLPISGRLVQIASHLIGTTYGSLVIFSHPLSALWSWVNFLRHTPILFHEVFIWAVYILERRNNPDEIRRYAMAEPQYEKV